MTKRGTKFIDLSEDLHDERYPIKETIQRLNNAVQEVCVKYGLFNQEVD